MSGMLYRPEQVVAQKTAHETAAKHERLCNLFTTMLQRLGVEIDAFGSGTGTLTGIH
jgi:hypothetical protein